jgi:hypothetical protein
MRLQITKCQLDLYPLCVQVDQLLCARRWQLWGGNDQLWLVPIKRLRFTCSLS